MFPECLAFEDWGQIGSRLKRMGRSVKWRLGDWLAYGERKYGEMYAQALDVTDYEYGTCRNAVWIAKQIELSRRRDNLSWSHHIENVRSVIRIVGDVLL